MALTRGYFYPKSMVSQAQQYACLSGLSILKNKAGKTDNGLNYDCISGVYLGST
jgi:hypothetical protein